MKNFKKYKKTILIIVFVVVVLILLLGLLYTRSDGNLSKIIKNQLAGVTEYYAWDAEADWQLVPCNQTRPIRLPYYDMGNNKKWFCANEVRPLNMSTEAKKLLQELLENPLKFDQLSQKLKEILLSKKDWWLNRSNERGLTVVSLKDGKFLIFDGNPAKGEPKLTYKQKDFDKIKDLVDKNLVLKIELIHTHPDSVNNYAPGSGDIPKIPSLDDLNFQAHIANFGDVEVRNYILEKYGIYEMVLPPRNNINEQNLNRVAQADINRNVVSGNSNSTPTDMANATREVLNAMRDMGVGINFSLF